MDEIYIIYGVPVIASLLGMGAAMGLLNKILDDDYERDLEKYEVEIKEYFRKENLEKRGDINHWRDG